VRNSRLIEVLLGGGRISLLIDLMHDSYMPKYQYMVLLVSGDTAFYV